MVWKEPGNWPLWEGSMTGQAAYDSIGVSLNVFGLGLAWLNMGGSVTQFFPVHLFMWRRWGWTELNFSLWSLRCWLDIMNCPWFVAACEVQALEMVFSAELPTWTCRIGTTRKDGKGHLYMESGQSQMNCDSVHAWIERVFINGDKLITVTLIKLVGLLAYCLHRLLT